MKVLNTKERDFLYFFIYGVKFVDFDNEIEVDINTSISEILKKVDGSKEALDSIIASEYSHSDEAEVYYDLLVALDEYNEDYPVTLSILENMIDFNLEDRLPSMFISAALTSFLNMNLVKKEINTDKKVSYYLVDNYNELIDKILEKLEIYIYAKKFIKKYNIEKSDNIIKKIENEEKIDDIDYDSSKIKNNKKELVNYMKNVVSLYMDIYSLKSRIDSLNEEREFILEENYIYDLVNVCSVVDEKISSLKKQISDLEEEINNQEIDLSIDLPLAPKFELSEPLEPNYIKRNIFNKKKADEENDKLRKEYLLLLDEYNKEKEKYNLELEKYNNKIEKIKKESKEKQEKELKEKNSKLYDKIDKFNKELKKLIDNKENEIENNMKDTESGIQINKIEYEINYIKTCVKKDVELRNKLLSYDIIYNKYRDMIPISSFIDYFSSERCSTLGDSNGAYNLYEQESRADLIIEKMDEIISSLESIKKNQYYIYEQLKEVNNNLELINGQLLVNTFLEVIEISKLDNIENSLDKIKENTEVSAYYAKKTANYTKALLILDVLDRL